MPKSTMPDFTEYQTRFDYIFDSPDYVRYNKYLELTEYFADLDIESQTTLCELIWFSENT